MKRVFISSTSLDLPEYRQVAVEVCNALGLVPLDMKDWSPRDVGATKGSLEKLDQAHVYVGIFAHRYGYVEPGSDRSVTEAEYDHAGQRGLERLCFLLEDDHPWPPSRIDFAQFDRLRDFKERLGERIVNRFTTVEDFRYKAHKALSEWQQRAGPAVRPLAPATVPGPVPHQLPSPPPDFIGRADLIEALLQDLGRGVTISAFSGLGGIGKTALALVLAERLAPRFPDGQVFLDLRGFSPPATPMPWQDAMQHVIRAFQPERPPLPDVASLRNEFQEVLHGKRVLLLLDNAATADQVEPLLPPGGCALLVTSRRRLVLPGLKPHDLDMLPRDEAVTLLRSIVPRLDEARAAALAEQCGRLPLALRLAGKALAVRKDWSPEDYGRRLRDARLATLSAVAASIRVSEETLPEPVRTRWRELAVFVGGFEKGWAAAVWDVDEGTADSFLGELIEQSLLDWDEEEGLYRLHDLVRDYAGAALAEVEREAAESRHAGHFLAVMREAGNQYECGGDAALEAVRQFGRASLDFQVLFAWALPETENRAARQSRKGSPERPRYHLWMRHQPDVWLRATAVVARWLGHQRGEADAFGDLGQTHATPDPSRPPSEFYRQPHLFGREIGDHFCEALVCWCWGKAFAKLGQLAEAILLLEIYVTFQQEIGHPDADTDAASVAELRQRCSRE